MRFNRRDKRRFRLAILPDDDPTCPDCGSDVDEALEVQAFDNGLWTVVGYDLEPCGCRVDAAELPEGVG